MLSNAHILVNMLIVCSAVKHVLNRHTAYPVLSFFQEQVLRHAYKHCEISPAYLATPIFHIYIKYNPPMHVHFHQIRLLR